MSGLGRRIQGVRFRASGFKGLGVNPGDSRHSLES